MGEDKYLGWEPFYQFIQARENEPVISNPRAEKEEVQKPNCQTQEGFSTVKWDTERLCATLESWPVGKKIKWSKVAREHGISAKNGGQMVKEFAKEIGTDTQKLDNRRPGKPMRAKKLKMAGWDISVPCHKTEVAVKADWAQMIQTRKPTLCEPCAPYKLTKYTVVDGQIKGAVN